MLSITTLAAVAALSGGQAYAPPRQEDFSGPQRVAPRGSYGRSCSNAYVNRGRLYADCRDQRGTVRGTSIELNRCGDYEIANSNGLLVCGPHRGDYERDQGGRPGGDRPGGGGWNGRASITVYVDSNYRGASTSFDGEISNLASSGFNDRISSIQLRGAWEVCTDAYFRGNCQVIEGDVANLSRIGLNDRISSLRPARRGGGGRW